jgi:hypothetical protein
MSEVKICHLVFELREGACQRRPAFATAGALGEWARAAEQFADYWGGAASWQNMSAERRNTFVEALKPNYFEWDAVMDETTPVEQWARLLPCSTLLVSDPNTVLPIREIMAILRRSCPMWTYKEISGGGHMAPLTRPDLVNPLVKAFLRRELCDDRASQPKVLGSLERLAAVLGFVRRAYAREIMAMLDDPRIDQLAPDRFRRRKRAFYVCAHQPRIAGPPKGNARRRPSG